MLTLGYSGGSTQIVAGIFTTHCRKPNNVFMKRLQILAFLLSATALNAIAGTVSPDLSAMPPGSPVQVIVQYSSPLGGLVSGV